MNLVCGELICFPCVEGGRFYCIISVENTVCDYDIFFYSLLLLSLSRTVETSTVTISCFIGMTSFSISCK